MYYIDGWPDGGVKRPWLPASLSIDGSMQVSWMKCANYAAFELPAFALKHAADSANSAQSAAFLIFFQKLQKLLLGVPPTNVNPGAVTLRTLVT
jgi:hypothetical protein